MRTQWLYGPHGKQLPATNHPAHWPERSEPLGRRRPGRLADERPATSRAALWDRAGAGPASGSTTPPTTGRVLVVRLRLRIARARAASGARGDRYPAAAAEFGRPARGRPTRCSHWTPARTALASVGPRRCRLTWAEALAGRLPRFRTERPRRTSMHEDPRHRWGRLHRQRTSSACCSRSGRTHEVVNVDAADLRRQPREPLASGRGRPPLRTSCAATSPTARPLEAVPSRSMRCRSSRRALRGREPRRPLDPVDGPATVRADQRARARRSCSTSARARGVERFVHVSHRRGLRDARRRPARCSPRTHAAGSRTRPYSASKAGADMLVRAGVRDARASRGSSRAARTTTGPTSSRRSSSR